MVETIVPVVHGDSRSPYRITVGLHVAGATASAAVLGVLLGGAGWALGAPWGELGVALVAVSAAVYLLREAAGLPVPIPDRHRQVPDWWRTFFSPRVAALLYGAGLGTGFLTYLSYGTFVAVAIAALASGEPLVGALVCAPFGLARGVSVLVARRARSGEEAALVVDRLERGAAGALPRALNAAALAAIVLAAIAALVD